VILARELREPDYVSYEDSLFGFDLRPHMQTNVEPLDGLVHKILPAKYALSKNQEYRHHQNLEKVMSSDSPVDIVGALRRRPTGFFRTTAVRRVSSLLNAMMGALVLIVLMIVLTLNPLVTAKTSIVGSAVSLFAIVLAFFTTAKNQEILAATAAYSAVLAAYIYNSDGTTQQAQSSSATKQSF
jgi:hypothetical protein